MRARPMNLAVRLVAALAITLGASSQSLAVLLCSSALCPMTAQKVEPEPCCDSKSAKQQETGQSCCCEIQDSSDTRLASTPVAMSASADVDLAVPAEPAAFVESVAVEAAQRIPFHSDHSPPAAHSLPDSERAPPVL